MSRRACARDRHRTARRSESRHSNEPIFRERWIDEAYTFAALATTRHVTHPLGDTVHSNRAGAPRQLQPVESFSTGSREA
jgi:hypothetical protein